MTSYQESHLSMYLVVQKFLNTNATAFSGLPNYTTLFKNFQLGVPQIQSFSTLQGEHKKGAAMDKKGLEQQVMDIALDVSRKTVAYAHFIKDNVLLQKVKYTETDLKYSPDTSLRDSCQTIYDCAAANASALNAYGVTAAVLKSLKDAIAAYNAAIPAPKLSIADRKKATEKLVVLFKEMDDVLESIDVLVETLKASNNDLYKQYKNLRKVVRTGTGSFALKGKVTDGVKDDGLMGATVRILGDGTGKLAKEGIVKKTAVKGGFTIKSLGEGSYKLMVSKPGYKDAMVTVDVTNGELAVVEVKLEKK